MAQTPDRSRTQENLDKRRSNLNEDKIKNNARYPLDVIRVEKPVISILGGLI